MPDSLHPVAVARVGARPQASPSPTAAHVPVRGAAPESGAAIGVSAMSLEDYARVVQARTEFVDFLLAPARGELATAA